MTAAQEFVFRGLSLHDTDRLGAALAVVIPDGMTVSLCGTLGAGKTRLVQAIAAACGIDRGTVVSPTYVLCQHYHGSRTLHHLDAYRIRDDDEFLELGVEELFGSHGVTLVEWGERVADCLPPDRLEIKIVISGECARDFHFRLEGELDSVFLKELEVRVNEQL